MRGSAGRPMFRPDAALHAITSPARQALCEWLPQASREASHKHNVAFATDALEAIGQLFTRPDSEIPGMDSKSRTLEDLRPAPRGGSAWRPLLALRGRSVFGQPPASRSHASGRSQS